MGQSQILCKLYLGAIEQSLFVAAAGSQLPPFQQHNAGGDGCQGRWSRSSCPWYPVPAVLLGHTLGKVDGHLGRDQAPVLPSSGPFFRNIHHS